MQTEGAARGTRYDDDIAQWAEEQVAALTDRRWVDLDVEHLVEEIGDVSRSLDRELIRHLSVLLTRLLEREAQPERVTSSSDLAEQIQADKIEDLLREAPSRRARLEAMVPATYRRARRLAACETELALDAFPELPSQHVLAALHAALERAKREAEAY